MVYCIGSPERGIVKIGHSINPQKRLMELKTGNPFQLEVLAVIEGDDKKERELHEKFKDLRLAGEWFSYTHDIKEYFFKEADNHMELEEITMQKLFRLNGADCKVYLYMKMFCSRTSGKLLLTKEDVLSACNYMNIGVSSFRNSITKLAEGKFISRCVRSVYVVH